MVAKTVEREREREGGLTPNFEDIRLPCNMSCASFLLAVSHILYNTIMINHN